MISVIVPIYNAESFLSDTIKSILRQSYKNFELLLINDGSTDGSRETCIAYGKKDARIKYFEKENSGVSDTRNYGINHAKGDFLVFVDADDTLPIDAFQIYMDEMSKTNADVIFANHSYNYNGTLLPRTPRIKRGTYTYQELQSRLLDDGTLSGILFGSVWGAFYKRSKIIENDIHFFCNVKVNEDGLFNINLLYHCSNIQVIDTICYYYRQRKSLTTKKLTKDARFHNCEREIISLLTKRGELNDYQRQIECRKASVTFWNALRVRNADANYRQSKKYLKELFDDSLIASSLKKLDYCHMNRYKKIICKLMKRKCTFLFYIIIRYFIPGLEKIIRR